MAAARTGNAVDLRWTNPSRTTDGLSLTGKHVPVPLMAEICREEGRPPVCSLVTRFNVVSDSPASFHDVLPGALAAGPARPMVYRVRMLNGLGKGAAATEIRALAGAAPAPLLDLQAKPVTGGVALHWLREPYAADRVLIHVSRGGQNGAELDASDLSKETITLAVEPRGNDAGGALDPGAHVGRAQRYEVTRIRTIHSGAEDLTMSSAPATVAVSARAKAAPPPPPADLEAVANTLAAPAIDLSWSPVPGAVTYRVYRAEGSQPPLLLTSEATKDLSYSDRTARTGVRYRYSVAALDEQGTAGARSPEVTEAIPQP